MATKLTASAAVAVGLAGAGQAALVAHYNMEQTGSPLADQVGTQTAVETGSGHQYSQAGPAGFGSSVGLNAAGSWDLSLADSAEIDLKNNFTVAAWIKYDSTINKGTLKDWDKNRIIGDNEAWDGDGWSFGYDSDNRLLFTKNGRADIYSNTLTGLSFDGAWMHVAAVVSSTSGVTFYVNGTAVGTAGPTHTADLNQSSVSGSHRANTDGQDAWAIGRANGTTQGQWFAGNIDEVRVYDEVLDATAIQALTVPEPSSLALIGLGGLAMLRRRRSA